MEVDGHNNVLFEPEIYRQQQFEDQMNEKATDKTIIGATSYGGT
jgi:nonsense-mediated mRNA decay protein 3